MKLQTISRLSILLLAASPLPAATEPGIVWEISNHDAEETTILGLASNPAGQIVATGDNGIIRSSDDQGLTWTTRDSGTFSTLNHPLWTGSRWIAAGEDGTATIVSSPDGINWSPTVLGDVSRPFSLNMIGDKVVYSSLTPLADCYLVSHESGESWVTNPSVTMTGFSQVVWTGTLHVATSHDGKIHSSSDGTNWTACFESATQGYYTLAWNGSRLLAMGHDYTADCLVVAHSIDALSWDTELVPDSDGLYPGDVISTGARFIILPGLQPPGTPPSVFTSPDGTTWNRHDLPATPQLYPSPPGVPFYPFASAICWTGSRLVVAGSRGYLATADLAAPAATSDWTERHIGYPGDYFTPPYGAVAQFNHMGTTRLVVVGSSSPILTSDDGGHSFTTQSSAGIHALAGITATSLPTLKLLAVGSNGKILNSPDGVTWNTGTSGVSDHLNSITWVVFPSAAPIAVTVGGAGTILTSDDGVTWKDRKSNTTSPLHHVSSGIPLFGTDPLIVAVGEGGAIVTSPDGITWTTQASATPEDLGGVTRNNAGFVAVGDQGTILASANGTSWTPRISNTTTDLTGATWTGTQLIAVGKLGTVLTSPDGVTWTARHTPVYRYRSLLQPKDIFAVKQLSPDRIIAVGSSGLFLTSRPAVDFADWMAHESPAPPAGQDGPDDDPNGDGISNLGAYGHGIPAVAATTADDLAALPRMLTPDPNGRLRLQLRVNTLGLGDLTYILEQSTTLEPGSWTEVFRQEPGQYNPTYPFPAHITSDGPDGTAIIELLDESLGARPAFYTRLRYELPTP